MLLNCSFARDIISKSAKRKEEREREKKKSTTTHPAVYVTCRLLTSNVSSQRRGRGGCILPANATRAEGLEAGRIELTNNKAGASLPTVHSRSTLYRPFVDLLLSSAISTAVAAQLEPSRSISQLSVLAFPRDLNTSDLAGNYAGINGSSDPFSRKSMEINLSVYVFFFSPSKRSRKVKREDKK